MRTSEIITFCYLCSQGIELLCRLSRSIPSRRQLPLANGVHDFHARERTARRPQRLEAEHGTSESFHPSMVLLHDIIEIFGVPNDNSRLVPLVIVRNCCRVRATLIDRDFLR